VSDGVANFKTFDWDAMAMNAVKGIALAGVFSAFMYGFGYFGVSKDASPQSVAFLLACTGFSSMYSVGELAPVAGALAAIGACLCLRFSTTFSVNVSSILSMFWPYTSLLYYSTFAYVAVGYFSKSSGDVLTNWWWKISLLSLAPFAVKLIVLILVSRGCRVSWPSSLTLALSLCSKGTVQIALCALLPLKVDLKDLGRFDEEAWLLQLFVLINYLVILPCIYALARMIVVWIRRVK